MAKTPPEQTVMLIAGETSGDHHGARLVRAMKEKAPGVCFCGIGGEAMRAAGVDIIVDAGQLSVVGITEVFSKMPRVLEGAGAIKRAIMRRRPDLLVLIDFPDFNLHMARFAKKHQVKVLYYISPQIWAWRSGRVHKIRRYVDHMAVILPFEADFYHAHDVAVTFVGHPLLDHYPTAAYAPPEKRADGKAVVGLLPGSRYSEIDRHLPVMLAAASQINQRIDGLVFRVSVAPSIDRQWLESRIIHYRKVMDIELAPGGIADVLAESTLVVAASGTVTLETAIHAVPMVIVYQISPLSYMLGRALVRVDHIGLANIIAGERVVPELIQADATPAKIAQTVIDLLDEPEALDTVRRKLQQVREKLGEPGASEKTADIALHMMQNPVTQPRDRSSGAMTS